MAIKMFTKYKSLGSCIMKILFFESLCIVCMLLKAYHTSSDLITAILLNISISSLCFFSGYQAQKRNSNLQTLLYFSKETPGRCISWHGSCTAKLVVQQSRRRSYYPVQGGSSSKKLFIIINNNNNLNYYYIML